jgi:hypothetical protein
MRRALVLALLAGCAQDDDGGRSGRNGQDGDQGLTGATGPAGAGGGYRWFDAEGAQVTLGGELLYWDEAGHAWNVDAETGALFAAYPTIGAIYYETSDCTGTAWVQAFAPRFVHTAAFDALTNLLPAPFLVRPDAQAKEQVCPASENLAGGCVPSTQPCTELLPLDAFLNAGAPQADFVGPLHPEPL